MKRKTLLIFLIIVIIAFISSVCYAIYKTTYNMQAFGDAGDIIIDLENKSAGISTILQTTDDKITYLFDVKNYKVQNELTHVNEIKADYFVNITGMDETKFNLNLYSLNSDNTETLLYKSSKHEFTDFYATNKILNIINQEIHSYKLEISLKANCIVSEDFNVVIDLAYIQHEDVEDVPNVPELANGMIPITWNGAQWVKADVTNANNDWYDYNNKKWANVATVRENGTNTRSFYTGANAGEIILNEDIETMWVWIPRFVYKINQDYAHRTISASDITSGDYLIDIHFSKRQQDGGDNWDSRIIVNNGNTVADSIGKWTTHPAFTFGDRELNGFWISKFKASNGTAQVASTITNIYSKPGVAVYKAPEFLTIISECRNMETKSRYGWNTASNIQSDGSFETDGNNIDIHLFKNSEWSAVSFLAQSIYGVGVNEVEVYYNEKYAGGSSFNEAFLTNLNCTTTHNAYGVYDMSHKYFEYVSAHIGPESNFATSILTTIADKYKDIYYNENVDYSSQESVYNSFANFKGAAIWEISLTGNLTLSTWFNGRSNIGYIQNSEQLLLMTRGGEASTSRGNMYGFGSGAISDVNDKMRSFRPVLIVGEGL